MKFFSLYSAAITLVVVAAQDASMQVITDDLTSTLTVTQTVPPTTTSYPGNGIFATECGPGAVCDLRRPPKEIDVYPSTTTKTITRVEVKPSTVTREVVKLVVTVTSIPIARIGLCPSEVTKVHPEPLTVFVEHVSTQVNYMVETTTSVTTSTLKEYYTAGDPCTFKSDFIFPVPTSPPGEVEYTVLGQQPIVAPSSAADDE